MSIKIAIADDHPLVISGLRYILGNDPGIEICGTFNQGADLLASLATLQPDVLLLDIQMPGKTGDELAAIINKKYPEIRMLALTNFDNVYHIKNMLGNGVLGYILKTSPEEILLEAVRTVYGGMQYLEPALEAKLKQDSRHNRYDTNSKPVLSRREKEILKLIAANLTSQQIAETLFISKRTVDNHRLSLLMKLDVKNVAALVKKAIEAGLIE